MNKKVAQNNDFVFFYTMKYILVLQSSLFLHFCQKPFLDPKIYSYNPHELTIASTTDESRKFFVNCQR